MSEPSKTITNLIFRTKSNNPTEKPLDTTDKKESNDKFPLIKSIVLHNDEYVVKKAKITIYSNNKIVFEQNMTQEKSDDGFRPRCKSELPNFFLNDLDEDDKACARKGFITPIQFPITIIVNAEYFDPWTEQSGSCTDKLSLNKLNPEDIIDGCLNISYGKNLSVKRIDKRIVKMKS